MNSDLLVCGAGCRVEGVRWRAKHNGFGFFGVGFRV